MSQTNVPSKKAVKYTYWLMTASTIGKDNHSRTFTTPFKVNAIFFNVKIIQGFLNQAAETVDLKWNIIFCMQLTKEQYKIYIDENL